MVFHRMEMKGKTADVVEEEKVGGTIKIGYMY